MLTNHTILFFTGDPPGAIWQDKPQIARRLARHNRVVVCGPELHLPSLAAQRRAGHWQLADLARPALVPEGEDLYRFSWAPWAPATGLPGLGGLTAVWRARRWRQVLSQLDTDRPILWLFRPGMLSLLEQFDPSLVIYHVVDEYSAYPCLSEAQATRQRKLDAQLTERADLVFCTARSLVEARQGLNPRTYYLPNAVDYRGFQRALLDPQLEPPQALAQLPGPRLGVVGGINAKLDLALLAALATGHPGWTLVLVGPLGYGIDRATLAQLEALPNVHRLPAVPPQQVPAVIAALDVCLIPYRINEQTRHVNPLKLYEYLAVGKPIVATPLPELVPFPAAVWLAADEEALAHAVDAALTEAEDPAAQATRRALAAANTWDHRVERMSALIVEALGGASG